MQIQSMADAISVDSNPCLDDVLSLLKNLRTFYPSILQWGTKKFFERKNKEIRFTTIKNFDDLAGLVISQHKEHYVKISTIYIKKKFRNNKMGSFILNKEIEYWQQRGETDFIITVSSNALHKCPILKPFLEKFSFLRVSEKKALYIQNEGEYIYKRDESVNSIVISIKPKYLERILCHKKKIEIRKRIIKTIGCGTKVYVYESSPSCNLVGYFTVRNILHGKPSIFWKRYDELGVSEQEFKKYCGNHKRIYGIEINSYRPLNKKIPLKTIRSNLNWNPPQNMSYCSKELINVVEKYGF